MTTDVFISYSRKDQDFVRQLFVALEAENRVAWVDWEGIPLTADWWAEIQGGIEAAQTFVFVISPDAAASEVCRRELAHAEQHNKRIVPIVYRDVSPKDLTESLNKLNWVFCRPADDFEPAFKALLAAMDTDLEWVKAHTRLLQRSLEWDNHGGEPSYLLRGVDLEAAEQRLTQTGHEPALTGRQVQYILASRQRQEAEQRGRLEAAQKLALEEQSTQEARRLVRNMVIGFTLFLIVASYWVYTYSVGLAVRQVDSSIIDTLRFTAAGIDGDELAELAQTSLSNPDGLSDDPRARKYEAWLNTVYLNNPRARPYLYRAGDDPNQVVLIAYYQGRLNAAAAARFLERDKVGQEDMLRGLQQMTINLQPRFDRTGGWVSGYLPLKNTRGQIVAAVGVDYQSAVIDGVRRTTLLSVISAALVAYLAMLGLIFIVARTFIRRSFPGLWGRFKRKQPAG